MEEHGHSFWETDKNLVPRTIFSEDEKTLVLGQTPIQPNREMAHRPRLFGAAKLPVRIDGPQFLSTVRPSTGKS